MRILATLIAVPLMCWLLYLAVLGCIVGAEWIVILAGWR